MITNTSSTEIDNLNKNIAQNPSPDNGANYSEAERIIKDARSTLAGSKEELLKIPKDTRVTQWGQTNFDTHAKLIKFLGLPADIAKARNQYSTEGRRIFKHIEKFENELGALEIDLRQKSISPRNATIKAAAIIREESGDAELVKSWQEHIKILRDGDKILRHKLAIEVLTPFVKEMSKRKANLVGAGYNTYRMFKDDGKDEDKESLAGFQLQAIDLEKRFKNLDISTFNGLAQSIITHQIKEALTATDQIKFLIEELCTHPPKEVKAIDKIEEDLINLRTVPANKILAEIEKLCASLAQNLLDLNNKTSTLKNFNILLVLLSETKLLQRTLRNTVIPELKNQHNTPDSPLNPQTIASEMSASFFYGIKGFLRLIKLLFFSAGSQQPVNSIELQKLIMETIFSCKTFYGNNIEDIKNLQTFIDDQLSEFNRPFPYQDLFKILKTAIATYGSRFEQSLFKFEIIEIDDKSEKSKTNLGTLIAFIKKHSSNIA
jgi:hypothetical protein